MKQVRLGIAGLGTVAQGVLQILQRNGDLLSRRTGIELQVQRVASRSAKPGVELLGAEFGQELQVLCEDPAVDIVVELIGSEQPALALIESALRAGKPVVTANKAVIAGYGNQLLDTNAAAPLRFEAAVAGAIPIIQAIRQGLIANRFQHVMGIINGTGNYILTAMQQASTSFEQALADAQKLGYAEADPTFDVEGIDAAHKLTILLALAFDAPFNFDDVYVEGISRISPLDITYAEELGYVIKHLGIARMADQQLEARVHPTLLPKAQLLANVNGVLNAVLVKSDAAGDTLFSGPGAGGEATASAVLADILEIAKQLPLRDQAGVGQARQTVSILPMDDLRSAYYLRIPTLDQPGVFAQAAQALSNHGVSIEAAIQKEPSAGAEQVSIVMLTNITQERLLNAALAQIQQLPQVTGDIARIRVESLA